MWGGGSPYLTPRLFPKEARGQAPWECPDRPLNHAAGPGLPGVGGKGQAQTDLRSSGTEGWMGWWGERSMGVSWRGSPPAALSRTTCFSLCFSVADELAYRVPPVHACLPRTPARALHPPEGALRPMALATLARDAFPEFPAGPGSVFPTLSTEVSCGVPELAGLPPQWHRLLAENTREVPADLADKV